MQAQDTIFREKIARIFDEDSGAMVMGILNVTTDSFFDGGRYVTDDNILEQAKKMVLEGVDIIDIGAYSTRPGAKDISIEQETEQLVNAIITVRAEFPELLISADTFRASVAEQAIHAGANIINDISGGTIDEAMFNTIANLKAPYILMHLKGTPQTMQQKPIYTNVVEEVYDFFENKTNELKALGLTQIILDPGFGFGKTLEHNYQMLRELEQFKPLHFPLLVGVSRKSMINKLLNTKPEEALNGTTVLNTLALTKGATILRVHDVKEAKEAIKMVEYLER